MYLGVFVIGTMEFKTQRAMLHGLLGKCEGILSAVRHCGYHISIECQPAPLPAYNLQQSVRTVFAQFPNHLRTQIGRQIMSFKGRPDPHVAEALDSKSC